MAKQTEAREGLIKHNAWRRGEEGIEMQNPRDIGLWIEAAIEALAIADRLMQDPSEEMIEGGWRKFDKFAKPQNRVCNMWRAMRDQMIVDATKE